MNENQNQAQRSTIISSEYIELRIKNQQKYHDEKAIKAKRQFIILNLSIMILSAIIPVITCFTDIAPLVTKVIISAAGGASTVISGYVSLSNVRSIFISSRATSEKLKTILCLYKTQSPPFDSDDASQKLVLMCESILHHENENWLEQHQKNTPPDYSINS